MYRTNIFLNSAFFHHFQKQILAESWKCDFKADILLDNFNRDRELYKDDTIFKQRRERVIPWIDNPHQWNTVILEACRELALQRPSIHSKVLEDLHILEALKDFVEHIQYFYTVASTMSVQGYSFQPLSQNSSKIHDLDKIDPIMLLGYSERFEDNASTSVWDLCVDRHVHVNPHHQVHAIWHNPSEEVMKLYSVGDSTCRHCGVHDISYRNYSEDLTACRHYMENNSTWKYLNKDSTSCGFRMENEATWKLCMKDRNTWRYCNDTNVREHNDEDTFAWSLCNEDDIAWKHCNKVDTPLVVFNEHSNVERQCNEGRDCNKVAIDLNEGGSVLTHCRVEALREMVCDKVARRLQKTLKGVSSSDMWDVEVAFFDGLPDEWMKKASIMMKKLKQGSVNVSL
ncbi:hypothetical protein JTE90_019325 [Oedothorax gibbosus]|uniref:Uncharacterized protein n=1 Tax=Oedothorax gibbosus TaxID=931172 RepID=A0AAV6UM60_9ARAC|nr:hypothetical protein JTE90_019325 [Oedothorax gibbosus]